MHIASALTAGIFSILLTAITSFALYQLLEEPAIRFGKRMAARLLSSRQSPQVLPDRSAPQLSRSASIPEPFIHILGSRVHLVSAPRAVDIMERWIRPRDGRCHQVVVTGFHGLLEAHKNPGFSAILNSAELWVPDGIAPVWLARIRGYRDAVRAPGTEIMSEFFARAQEKGYSSYFYGDTERTLAALTATAQRLYPGHRVAGTYSPPFRALTAAEDEAILARINAARPDVLWVALGLPKQDVWIYERLHRLNVPVAIGVGAAFAFVAGTVSRCPAWMGNAGFEWVYRLLREPQKLWRRDLFDGPRFLFHAGLELFRTRDYRPPELTRE